jgi:hypothetical protein
MPRARGSCGKLKHAKACIGPAKCHGKRAGIQRRLLGEGRKIVQLRGAEDAFMGYERKRAVALCIINACESVERCDDLSVERMSQCPGGAVPERSGALEKAASRLL